MLTQICLASHKRTCANTVDPDQASDLGLQCLHLGQELLKNVVTIKTNQTHFLLEMDWSKELR